MGIQERQKQRGEISLPNISGIPGIIVKDPVIAETAMDDARSVFAETYSMNGIDIQNGEVAYFFEKIDRLKEQLRWSAEGLYSQEDRAKVRKRAIDLMRSASDFHAENQKRKANGNGGNGKVIFDSSQL